MRVMDIFYALPFNLMAICIVASPVSYTHLHAVLGRYPRGERGLKSAYAVPTPRAGRVAPRKGRGLKCRTRSIFPSPPAPLLAREAWTEMPSGGGAGVPIGRVPRVTAGVPAWRNFRPIQGIQMV